MNDGITIGAVGYVSGYVSRFEIIASKQLAAGADVGVTAMRE